MSVSSRLLVALGLGGVGAAIGLVWAMSTLPAPGVAVVAVVLVLVGAMAVGPWLVLTARHVPREPLPDRLFRRVQLLVGCVLAFGIGLAAFVSGRDSLVAGLVLGSVVVAGLVGMVAGVLVPWISHLVRTVNRERGARVLAEERATVAAHLHDTVLQSLTLIQKRTDDPAMIRLARGAERDLRAWLYGERDTGDDYAGAVRAVVAQIEELHPMTVDLVCAGTRPLDDPARAVVGAIREALTNTARHADVRRVSVFTEAADAELIAVVRDRGRGFDPVAVPGDRRGIADSIVDRVRRSGGAARVHSAVGEGTEVELHMPVTEPTQPSTMDGAGAGR